MGKLVCKSVKGIKYMYFGRPHQTVFCTDNLWSSQFKDVEWLDLRKFNVVNLEGCLDNEHHLTGKSYYYILAEPIAQWIGFPYNVDDFDIVDNYIDGYDFSYPIPKHDYRFSISINGNDFGSGDISHITNIQVDHCADGEADGGEDAHTPYHRLYRGAHCCSRIINETIDNDKSIVITGDSMMIPMIPIIACYYKETVMLDNRDDKSHLEYFEGKVFDNVVIQGSPFNAPQKTLGINLR